MALWIDSYDALEVGEIGFLVRVQDQNHGCAEHYRLQDRAQCTNQSLEPRLRAWCGTTNNVAIYAEGLARVVRVTKNDRAMLVKIPQSEEAAALEALGYPELAED